MLKSVVFQAKGIAGHSVISSPKLEFDRMPINKSQLGKVKRFRKVVFKLSDRQRSLVERCARYERTTPNKFIKSAISNRVEKYAERIEEEDRNKVSENQLALFNFSNEGVQTSLFD